MLASKSNFPLFHFYVAFSQMIIQIASKSKMLDSQVASSQMSIQIACNKEDIVGFSGCVFPDELGRRCGRPMLLPGFHLGHESCFWLMSFCPGVQSDVEDCNYDDVDDHDGQDGRWVKPGLFAFSLAQLHLWKVRGSAWNFIWEPPFILLSWSFCQSTFILFWYFSDKKEGLSMLMLTIIRHPLKFRRRCFAKN